MLPSCACVECSFVCVCVCEQQICVSESIFCIVRKSWPYPPTASGSYGREADEIRVDFEILKLLYKLNYSEFYFV